MDKKELLLANAAQIATPLGHSACCGDAMQAVKVYENASLLVREGKIAAIGAYDELKSSVTEQDCIDVSGKTLIPGFVDSHTHFVFGGYRAEEFLWRMEGMSYMEIMQRGGGIVSTVQATRQATKAALVQSGRKRLQSMLAFGVTTVEGKSGYGLDCDTELKQLKVMHELNEVQPLEIVPTFLGAHAVPPEYAERSDAYLQYLVQHVMTRIKAEKLAEYCDIFCEEGVFSLKQSATFLRAARAAGFKLKMHADEIVAFGGAELAAQLGCTSADHLLHISRAGIASLAEKYVVATVLPTTAFCLKEPYAPVRKMIEAGCAVALATDFNPGSGFTNSVPLLFALAVIYMKMTAAEALTALTLNGAAALDRADRIGSLEIGKQADVVVLDYPSYKFLPYYTGVNIVQSVIKKGQLVWQKTY